jgi:DNA repair exonuclease SbcCD ATPase subunit
MNFDNPTLVSEMERKAFLAGDSQTVDLLSELDEAKKSIQECDKVFELIGVDRNKYGSTLAEQIASFVGIHEVYRKALIDIQDITENTHFNDEEALVAIIKVIDKVDLDD